MAAFCHKSGGTTKGAFYLQGNQGAVLHFIKKVKEFENKDAKDYARLFWNYLCEEKSQVAAYVLKYVSLYVLCIFLLNMS